MSEAENYFQRLATLQQELTPTPANPLPLHPKRLNAVPGWANSEGKYCLRRVDVLALMAALGSQRPLLLTGEPGCGKSSMARAFAALLDFDFIPTMIKPGRSHESLLWEIDAVDRFAQAQLPPEDRKPLGLEHYLTKGPVWEAFDRTKINGTVLLLDEIDKAELTMVNGLLDVLGESTFTGPTKEQVSRSTAHPLVVILTSNGDRLMPPAVIRRCAQHTVELPEQPQELENYLISIATNKFDSLKGSEVLQKAANIIVSNRGGDRVKPGVSEYIDLINVWQKISAAHSPAKATRLLDDCSGFFVKQSL